MAHDPANGALGQVHENAVANVVDRLDRLADRGSLSLGDVIEAFGETSFVPLLMVPALLVVSPLSGIPLFSSVCGLAIALVAAQWLLGRDYAWLPTRLRRLEVGQPRVRAALKRIRRLADWLDSVARDRFAPLVSGPMSKLPQALCVICGLSMPFLELVPLSSSILGMAVLLFSAGFLARDGIFAIGGMALMSVASLVPLTVISLV